MIRLPIPRPVAYALAGAIVGALVAAWAVSARVNELRADATAVALRGAGWTEGRTRLPPKLEPDPPPGADRVASVRVRVRETGRDDRDNRTPDAVTPGHEDRDTAPPREDRMPTRPSSVPGSTGWALPLTGPEDCPEFCGCDVRPGDLFADLSVHIVRAGNRPFGVVVGELGVRLPDDRRVVRRLEPPETEADAVRSGQELDLWVAASSVKLPRRWTFAIRKPRHWRTGWSAGAGLCHDALNRTAPCVAAVWGVQF